MPTTRVSLRAGVGLVLVIAVVSAGCQSASRNSGPNLGTPPFLSSRVASPPGEQTHPIAPQSVVRWSVASGQGEHSAAVTGRDVVAPDGTLRIGTYGVIQVGGLTTEQAKTAISAQVGKQVTDARVVVQVEGAAQPKGTFRRLLSKKEEPPLLPQTNGSPAESKPPSAISQMSHTGSPGITMASKATPPAPVGESRPRLFGGKNSPGEGRIRPISASDPELAPQPSVLVAPGHGHYVQSAAMDKAVPREMSQISLPPYVIDPPDILLVEAVGGIRDQPVRGQHLVRPDGTISLGIYGTVHVKGLTLEEARLAVANQLALRAKIDAQNVHVDVLAYNSKFFYVVTDGAGYGEQVVRLPITGSETVLDALAQVNGLPPVASKKHIWVARRAPMDGNSHQVLPVDWVGIVQRGSTATNYQIMPGDRVYVQSDKLIRIDNGLAKVLNPIERMLGVTLLGSSVVNSIQGRNLGGGLGGFP